MMGSFLSRALLMAFGYAYPAYQCFKVVEKNKPEIEQLLFWCQYWILVALLTVCERVGDNFISWLPLYSEAKLAFFIYLWYPKRKGTGYIYNSFFRPFVAKHETEIDRSLLEMRAKAGEISIVYWQKAVSFGQIRLFEILQYVSSQSTSCSQPDQASATTQKQLKQPVPGSSQQRHEPAQEAAGHQPTPPTLPHAAMPSEKTVDSSQSVPEAPCPTKASDLKAFPDEPVLLSSGSGSANFHQQEETAGKEAILLRHGKWTDMFRARNYF